MNIFEYCIRVIYALRIALPIQIIVLHIQMEARDAQHQKRIRKIITHPKMVRRGIQ
ncbi:MAG TPA: hypothetical protein VJH89_01345 [Patescibacteria group bacterium]|nr:hypothetical protein [Patescibacteria group bacterium]